MFFKVAILSSLVFLPTLANAQAPSELPADLLPKSALVRADQMPIGWSKKANLGLNLSFASNSNVIGQTDGQTQTYGLNLKGHFDRADLRTEWRNTLSYAGATSKTPTLDRYSKSSDELKIESIYLYSFDSAPTFGPYAKASAQTAVFKGEDIRATPATYVITARDGSSQTVVGDSLRLTDGFHPLTTSESVGGFWKAVENEKLKVETRLGFGAQQINAAGQLSVTGSAPGGAVSVNELRNVSQAGLEAAVTAIGKIDDRSGYEVGIESLTPFVSDKEASDDRSAWRLTNVEGRAKLTSNITAWAAFAYDYKLVIQPQLLDKTQQAHMLVLNINYNLL